MKTPALMRNVDKNVLQKVWKYEINSHKCFRTKALVKESLGMLRGTRKYESSLETNTCLELEHVV